MIGIIVQARMSSSRLPSKVMRPLAGQPMLYQQIKRLQRSQLADTLIIATSDDSSDDAIASLCTEHNITHFRGSLDDVLARFYFAAKANQLKTIVRICGDCPLIDAALVDSIIQFHTENHADYTSNCVQRYFPDGQDIEVFSFLALEQAYLLAKKPSEREHVTPFIRDSGQFTIKNYPSKIDLSAYRICVDHQADFDVANAIFTQLTSQIGEHFGVSDITHFLDNNPKIKALNADIELNEGYKKSLAEDKLLGFK